MGGGIDCHDFHVFLSSVEKKVLEERIFLHRMDFIGNQVFKCSKKLQKLQMYFF